MKKFLIVAVLSGAAHLAQAQEVNKLSPQDVSEGFKLLYDGTLASFKANFVDYIKDNTTNTNLSSEWAVNATTGAVGIQANTEDVRSRVIYKDFELRLDYRCDANQGIFYRTLVNTDRAWQTGIEVAINNYTNQNKDAPGAAYDLYAPNPNAYYLHNSQKWNSLRVVAKADSIEHWMNGTKVVGFKLHSPAFWTAYAASKWNSDKRMTFKVPGNQAAGYIEQGYLGFQADHGGKWEIRNLKISDKPCHGAANAPDRATRCGFTPPVGIERRDAGLDAGPALLRRASGGLELSLGATDVLAAELVSLDGKVHKGAVAHGKATFRGTFRGGLYVARLRSVGGEFTRRLNIE